MEPNVVSLHAFTVVGMKYRGKNEQNEIPQLWGQFAPRVSEIQHKVQEDATYGVMSNYDEVSGEFDYWASLKVTQAVDLPAGMEGVEVPAATYAVWECTLPTIHQAYQQAHAWFAQSEHENSGTPEFEYYGPGFNPQDPGSAMKIFMPIK
jgi:AraC family transcriptional regulator